MTDRKIMAVAHRDDDGIMALAAYLASLSP
jgi:hypothetical protein